MEGIKISRHITLKEAIYSATAARYKIPNTPSPAIIETMKLTAEKVFEPARIFANVPLQVISFYRSALLNSAVGGARNSQHVKGEAIDFIGNHIVSSAAIFRYLQNNVIFDQLIWEFGTNKEPDWIHVSYSKARNRREVLRAFKKNGFTHYERFRLI